MSQNTLALHHTGGSFATIGVPALGPLSLRKLRGYRGKPHRGGYLMAVPGPSRGQADRRQCGVRENSGKRDGARREAQRPGCQTGRALCSARPGPPVCGPAALPQSASARPVPPAARCRAHAALCPAWFVIVNGRTIGTSALSSSIKTP